MDYKINFPILVATTFILDTLVHFSGAGVPFTDCGSKPGYSVTSVRIIEEGGTDCVPNEDGKCVIVAGRSYTTEVTACTTEAVQINSVPYTIRASSPYLAPSILSVQLDSGNQCNSLTPTSVTRSCPTVGPTCATVAGPKTAFGVSLSPLGLLQANVPFRVTTHAWINQQTSEADAKLCFYVDVLYRVQLL